MKTWRTIRTQLTAVGGGRLAGAGLILGAVVLAGCGSQTQAATQTPAQIAKQLVAQSGNPVLTIPGGGQRYIFLTELITFLTRNPAYTVFEDDAPAGYPGPPAHIHVRQDEGFYVLQGQVTFRGGRLLNHVIVAHPGTYVRIPKGTLHTWAVTGKTEAKVLTVFSPPGDFETMITHIGHPTTNTVPPPYRPLSKATINKIAALAPKIYIVFPGAFVKLPK